VYSTCIYCRQPLGANETIEHFPIGRRLAFDATKGRLWVVCSSCQRWNLTPLEERWEAIEECERLFRDTRKRYSSENIGLARARDGLDLVRVGRPLRPEFAAWRYGAQFTRRRRNHLITAAAATGGGWAIYASGIAVGAPFFVSAVLVGVTRGLLEFNRHGRRSDIVANIEATDGSKLAIQRGDLPLVRLVPEKADRWGLSLPTMVYGTVHLVDAAAIRVASLALARHNSRGASPDEVETAVAKLEQFKDSEGLLRFLGKQRSIAGLDVEHRLALEMAAHEDAERRALEGELHELELAWKDAEQIAAISDDMFLPAAVSAWMRKHRPLRGSR